MRTSAPLIALLIWSAVSTNSNSVDLVGELSLQGQLFPQSPAFEGQKSSTQGFVLNGSLYGEIADNISYTLTPLVRYDSADSQRTHGDIREAYLLMYGDWDDTSWEIRLGIGQTFWGVAELTNLVDIVNQLDLVEHPRNRPKLGQPMVHLTLSGSWGMAETFVLPYHRTRTFPGPSGRLRSRYSIDDNARYESSSEERSVDFAFRYSNSVGLVDFGLSAFAGTSREPSFVVDSSLGIPIGNPSLIPYYEEIEQYGVDAQLTTELLLYKVEAIQRKGLRNLLGQEQGYKALILGAEHTVYNLFGSPASVTLLGEWLYDNRGTLATNVWANDVFLAGFLSFNDMPGTEFVAGLLADLNYDYRAVNLEYKRRLSGSWLIRVESIINVRSDPLDITYDGRRDSFIGIDFTVNF